MEKFEGLTIEQLIAKRKEVESAGFAETQTIENVEVGKLSGLPQTMETKVNGKKVRNASFSLITFERTDKNGKIVKLFFEACAFNLKHLSTGKSYDNVNVKVTEELKEKYSQPENLTKEAMLESVPYTDGSGRKRTIVKLESIAA